MIPKVVIVGRPNVGKSSLLNMLAGRMVSIVDPTPGVTRDRISTYASLLPPEGGDSLCIEIIDTGGHGIIDSQNLTDDVERQIALGIAEADLILFLIDSHTGVLPLDIEVAKLLRMQGCAPVKIDLPAPPEEEEKGGKRKKGKAAQKKADKATMKKAKTGAGRPVLLVANKVDDRKYEGAAQDAARLGYGAPVMISTTSRHNHDEFIDTLRRAVLTAAAQRSLAMGEPRPQFDAAPDAGIKIAIVGKRNAGKSTLVNAFAGADRVIVSEVEGTTRDSVDVRFELGEHVFTAIDTAGVRKRKSIAGDIEFYSTHRAMRSIRRADVVLLLIDATVPVSQVDEQLSMEIQREFKPCCIVVSKWDLVEHEHTQEEYAKYLEKHLRGFNYAPVAFISAKKDEGIRDVLSAVLSLHEQAGHRVPTSELNEAFKKITDAKQPAAIGGKRFKIYYVTQLDVRPPTIALFVNAPFLFDAGYQRYMMNRMRELLPFSEVPIKLLVRGKEERAEDEVERRESRRRKERSDEEPVRREPRRRRERP